MFWEMVNFLGEKVEKVLKLTVTRCYRTSWGITLYTLFQLLHLDFLMARKAPQDTSLISFLTTGVLNLLNKVHLEDKWQYQEQQSWDFNAGGSGQCEDHEDIWQRSSEISNLPPSRPQHFIAISNICLNIYLCHSGNHELKIILNVCSFTCTSIR